MLVLREGIDGSAALVVALLSLLWMCSAGGSDAATLNLASAACECTPLMSSQKADKEQEIEKALDGKPETKWVSEAGTFPNWVELRWPQPVTLSQLNVAEDPVGRTGRYRVEAFVDRAWKTVVPETVNTAPKGDSLTSNFARVSSTRLRYTMLTPAEGDAATAVSSIRELQALGEAQWVSARLRMERPAAINGATFRLVGQHAIPATVEPGGRVQLRFEVQTPAVIPADYGFQVTLGEPVLGKPQWGADYTVAHTYLWPETDTSRWQPGRTYALATDLYLPLWAPHGKIPLRLEPVGQKLLGQIADHADGVIGQVSIRRFPRDPAVWPAVTPKSELRYEDGQTKLYVNGRRVGPFIMTEEDHPAYELFGSTARTGIHVWRVCAFKWVNVDHTAPEGRTENDKWFVELDQQVQALLRCDPEAYVIVVAVSRPSTQWTQAHPDDAALMANGKRLDASLSSPRWQGQVQADHTAMVRHLMAQPYAGHVIGVQFEVALETQYPGSDEGYNKADTPREEVVVGDFSAPHLAAFRQWLRKRYGDDLKALQTAWHDPAVTFDSAAPDIKVLRREDLLLFKDPALTRMPLDFWEFHSQSLADMTNLVGRTIKEASGGRYLCGLWGFYSNGFRGATGNPGVQHFGFGEFRDIVQSPYVDYVVALRSYAMFRWGTPAVPTNLADTLRQHGKMLLVEYDDRTFYAGYRDMPQHSQQETLALERRNWSASGLRGDGLWWMGFGGVDFGGGPPTGRAAVPWHSEDSIVANLTKGRRIYNAIYQGNGSRSVSEVAVFMNNQDVYDLDLIHARRLLASCQYQTAYFELPKLGAPVDYYLVDDIGLPVMDQYKVYVFLNANYLTPAQRAKTKSVALRAGKTVLWLYAPGFCDGDRLSTANITDLTGFTVSYDKELLRPQAALLPGHALTEHIDPQHLISAHQWENDVSPYAIGPIFYVDDPAAEPLGTYVHNRSRVAYAAKTVNGARSLYLGVPYLDAAVLRQVCRVAGVHLYAQTDAIVDAASNYLMITGGESGFSGDVPLPRASYVYDVNAGRLISDRCTSFRAEVPARDSALYYVAPDGRANPFVRTSAAK